MRQDLRKLLSLTVVLSMLGAGLAACATEVEVTRVVKETVVETVIETIQETVVVEGTPEVVEREVTKVVEVEKVVTPTPEPAPAPTATPAKTQGGTLVIAYENEPRSFNVYIHAGSPESVIAGNVYCSFLRGGPNFELLPNLADSWEISDDRLTYTLHLNPNAMWHDGVPVTTADVEFSANEIWPNGPLYGSRWKANVKSLDVIDDHTFSITLNEPYQPFIDLLSSIHLAPYPKHLYEGTDFETNPYNWAPVGNGPFKFKDWVKGSYIELVRNDDYFKPGLPYLDRLVMQIIPDANSRLLAFERGEVDWLHSYIVPYDRIATWRQDPRFTVVDFGLGVGTIELLLLNLDNEYLQHQEVRQALAHAIDNNELNQIALFGAGTPATSHIASNQPFYNPNLNLYGRDPDKANQLLDEAGFPRGEDGKRFGLRLSVKTGTDYEERAAQVIKSQLDDVGIDVEITMYDLAVMVETVFEKRDFDMHIQLYVTGANPSTAVARRYAAANIGAAYANAMGWVNDEYEQIIAEEVRQDDTTRREMWYRVQEILMEELPAIPLYEMPNVNVHSSKFADVITDANWGYLSQSREDAYYLGD